MASVARASAWLDGRAHGSMAADRTTSPLLWAAPYGGFTPDVRTERRVRGERDLQDALTSTRDFQSNRFAEYE